MKKLDYIRSLIARKYPEGDVHLNICMELEEDHSPEWTITVGAWKIGEEYVSNTRKHATNPAAGFEAAADELIDFLTGTD